MKGDNFMPKKLIGYCAVDSGQIMISDPCYSLDGEYGDTSTPYGKCCEITTQAEQAQGEVIIKGTGGSAVVSSTATGDGSYPVYATYTKGGQIKSLTIEFDVWSEDKDGNIK